MQFIAPWQGSVPEKKEHAYCAGSVALKQSARYCLRPVASEKRTTKNIERKSKTGENNDEKNAHRAQTIRKNKKMIKKAKKVRYFMKKLLTGMVKSR
ncbi:MAG TPA: hypothetical protein IAA30_00395 [Candidatus Treponema faecavium]|nr:hypothetical protein [Candidatus Treponema faecavium]